MNKVCFFGSVTYGILVLRPGIEPTPPALEAWSRNHWTTREVPEQGFKQVKAQSYPVGSAPRRAPWGPGLFWVSYSTMLSPS